jgi:hypothetical protein
VPPPPWYGEVGAQYGEAEEIIMCQGDNFVVVGRGVRIPRLQNAKKSSVINQKNNLPLHRGFEPKRSCIVRRCSYHYTN